MQFETIDYGENVVAKNTQLKYSALKDCIYKNCTRDCQTSEIKLLIDSIKTIEPLVQST